MPTSGRPHVSSWDDQEQVVRNRLDVYRTQTAPLIAYCQDRPTFCRVNGAQLFDRVKDELVCAVERVLGRLR